MKPANAGSLKAVGHLKLHLLEVWELKPDRPQARSIPISLRELCNPFDQQIYSSEKSELPAASADIPITVMCNLLSLDLHIFRIRWKVSIFVEDKVIS